jgi:DNA-binding MarR family transcriptional regulator
MPTLPTRTPPTLESTIDCFWESVPPLWNRIREHLREHVLAGLDLTVEQFHVLRHIRRGLGSVSDLAAAKHISRPAISQAVDLLVAKGLIERQPNAVDRRYVRLTLTAAGNDLLDTVFQQNRAWMAQRLAHLAPRELESIQAGLRALQSAFDEPAR